MGSHGEFDLADCGACGLRFSDPMEHPGQGWYEESELYEEREDTAPIPVPPNWRHDAFLADVPGPGRVLDLGCGDGGFLVRARDAGWEPHGVELDPRGIARASARGITDIRQGYADQLAPGEEGFDAVTAFEFMEHVPDPVELARTMAARLAPGGVAYVTVPHLDRWPALFDPDADVPPHHLTLWTRTALETLFARAGFQEVEIREAPLTVADVFMHYKWAEARVLGGEVRRRLVHYPVYALLVLVLAAWKLLGWARGHTLVAKARIRGGVH